MFKVLVPVMLSLLISMPANASTLEDLNRELKTLHDLIVEQESVLREVVNNLPDQTIDELYNTQVGEDAPGMSEADLIDYAMGYIMAGSDGIQFYLDHVEGK